jgi:hypothetical protein
MITFDTSHELPSVYFTDQLARRSGRRSGKKPACEGSLRIFAMPIALAMLGSVAMAQSNLQNDASKTDRGRTTSESTGPDSIHSPKDQGEALDQSTIVNRPIAFARFTKWIGVGVHTKGKSVAMEFQTHQLSIDKADSQRITGKGRWIAYSQQELGRGDYTMSAILNGDRIESADNKTSSAKGFGSFVDGGFLWRWQNSESAGENWYVPVSLHKDATSFTGKYQITTSYGQTYEIDLLVDGTAKETKPAPRRGAWVGAPGRVMIVWSDGWRDMLNGKSEKLMRRAYGPGVSLIDAPTEAGHATLVQSYPPAEPHGPQLGQSKDDSINGSTSVVKEFSNSRPATRSKIPDEPSLAKAKAKIAELMVDLPIHANATERIALARKLLTLAAESKDDPAAEYALLDEARIQAAKAGDFVLTIGIVDQLATSYQISVHAEKAATLETAWKQIQKDSKSLISLAQFAAVSLAACDHAIDDDAFSESDRMARIALAAAELSTSTTWIDKAKERLAAIRKLESLHADYRAAAQVLKQQPDNPEACRVAGKYLCLAKRRWQEGLIHLAKCDSEQLRVAATLDLSSPTENQDQLQCGDQWWDLALNVEGETQQSLKQRAVHWYQLVAQRLKGLDRARIEKRISEAKSEEPIELIDLMEIARLTKAAPDGRVLGDGRIFRFSGELGQVHLPTNLPSEYELIMEVRRPKREDGHLSIHLLHDQLPIFVVIDGIQPQGRHCRVFEGDKMAHIDTEVFRDDKWHELRIDVRRTGVTAYADGRELLTFVASTDLRPTPSDDGNFKHRVDLLGTKATYEVRRLEVASMTGRLENTGSAQRLISP